jgi:hypothetical protein
MGARYDIRFPDKYTLVNDPGLKSKFRMVFQNAFS